MKKKERGAAANRVCLSEMRQAAGLGAANLCNELSCLRHVGDTEKPPQKSG